MSESVSKWIGVVEYFGKDTQDVEIDLPDGKKSGLKHAISILNDIKGIEIINLTYKDVVRHPLVAEIIKAYSKSENKK